MDRATLLCRCRCRTAVEQVDEAVDRPRFGPTGHGGGALRVLALRRAPGARSLSTVFGRHLGGVSTMDFGSAPAALAALAAAASVIAFPIYGWVRDRKRRGERISMATLLGVIVLGLLGVVSLGML